MNTQNLVWIIFTFVAIAFVVMLCLMYFVSRFADYVHKIRMSNRQMLRSGNYDVLASNFSLN